MVSDEDRDLLEDLWNAGSAKGRRGLGQLDDEDDPLGAKFRATVTEIPRHRGIPTRNHTFRF